MINYLDSKFILVDFEDEFILKKYKWFIKSNGYVTAKINGKFILLHRLIMKAKKNKEIDHINRDKLDNRKINLRFCNRSENMHNVTYEGRTKHLGAVWHTQNKYWTSKIRLNGKRIHLGCFKTIKDAQTAYFTALRKNYA